MTPNPGVNNCDGDICFHLAEISSDPGWSRCGPGKLANTGKVPAKIVRREATAGKCGFWLRGPLPVGRLGSVVTLETSRGIVFNYG